MDAAYLHLLVNHFPVALGALGTAAAVLAVLMRRRAVWTYATATLTLAGLCALPAFFSGRAAEDVMDHEWYVVRGSIHTHEEAGELALWIMLAVALVSAYAWIRLLRGQGGRATDRGYAAAADVPGWLKALVLLGGLAGSGASGYAAFQGGKIVHKSERLLTPPITVAPTAVTPPPPAWSVP